MSHSELPARASLEYLKKLAKERLRDLRSTQPDARLATVQRALAREYGFPSWRALREEVDRRADSTSDAFFRACAVGDVPTLRRRLDLDPSLVDARTPDGATPLHAAVRHPDALRLLLERGADPNARDAGDNALPLHFAVGSAPIESVRVLLDAGSDVQGEGDVHEVDTIGFATVYEEARRDVVELLVARGARHHVFSAIALGDPALLRQVVENDPAAIHRRLSGFEQAQTALHYVIAPPDGLVGGRFRTGEHYHTLALLLELGADIEARDAKGRTPMELAMLRGDREAMRLLRDAGATLPRPEPSPTASLETYAGSVGLLSPMLAVADVDASVAWYRALGFRLTGSNGGDGHMDFAAVQLGDAEIMFVPVQPGHRTGSTGVSLWIHTTKLDELYAVLKRRSVERSRAELAGETTDAPDIRFMRDLYTAFYGQREFAILDPDGTELCFYQPLE